MLQVDIQLRKWRQHNKSTMTTFQEVGLGAVSLEKQVTLEKKKIRLTEPVTLVAYFYIELEKSNLVRQQRK